MGAVEAVRLSSITSLAIEACVAMRNQCQAITCSGFARNSPTWSPAAAKAPLFCPSRPGIVPDGFAPVLRNRRRARDLAGKQVQRALSSRSPIYPLNVEAEGLYASVDGGRR